MTTRSTNPTGLAAIPHKTTADNGGTFGELLQPKHKIAFVADPSDLATSEAAIIAIRDGLIAVGLMKAS